ncbi:hypothetical protein JXQ70_09070 [bacterium]|nr:hypothetical protein [bacterium]
MLFYNRRCLYSTIISFLLCLFSVGLVEAMNFKEIVEHYKDREFYLQHNLWYRDQGKIYWFNYILAGDFIPIGSKVTVIKVKSNTFKFKVEGRTEKFSINMWNCQISYEKFISRILGESPPVLEGLNEVDQKGIQFGKVIEGMSRKGVFFAVGYPPSYSPSREFGSSDADKPLNQSLDSKELVYFKNRFDRILYYFDENDLVVNIRD